MSGFCLADGLESRNLIGLEAESCKLGVREPLETLSVEVGFKVLKSQSTDFVSRWLQIWRTMRTIAEYQHRSIRQRPGAHQGRVGQQLAEQQLGEQLQELEQAQEVPGEPV